jgi:tetratricopeptide (TPR) repeat protein
MTGYRAHNLILHSSRRRVRGRRSRSAGAWLLAVLAVCLSLGAGCNRKAKPQQPRAATPAQPPAAAPPPKPAAPPEEAPRIILHPPPSLSPPLLAPGPPPADLVEGEESFYRGNYREAARAYEKFLHENPDHRERPEVMFRLGMAYALSGPSQQSQKLALEVWKSLIRLYPDSPLRVQAAYLLELNADIERLKSESEAKDESIKRMREELERIKKIDIERRQPMPPR